MKKIEVRHLGCPGHLIVARFCHWRRHTQIGDFYRVSTVGDYYIDSQRQTVGSGEHDFFETMVFKTNGKPENGSDGCGCLQADFSEIDGTRYATAGSAQAGHDTFVAKYLKLARAKQSKRRKKS